MSTLTEQDVLDSMEKIRPFLDQPGDLGTPFGIGSLMGHKVVATPPPDQKYRLNDHVQVSPGFRSDYNAWLLERFGTQEPMLRRGEVWGFCDIMIMRPETAAMIPTV